MRISVAKGDGIGPEVMDVVLAAFKAARVPLEYDIVAMGKQVALSGEPSGISPEAKASVESTGVLFKGPMETPTGGGYKSVNVTARKMWGTFANERVYRCLPGVTSPLAKPDIDLIMVRENIEDTYGGIEHMQTHDVAQCRRLITRPGCEQVHRHTFEAAKRRGAKRVTCAHKANIMKFTDGLFLDTFYDVANDYPEFEVDDVIVDAMAMKLVLNPGAFDVVVLPNLQGDILSDLAAGLVGGLAYAPSANIGDAISIFEAVHGTAPDIAGQGLANPTALLLSGLMMLRYLGLKMHAESIEKSLVETLAELEGQAFRTQIFAEKLCAKIQGAPPVEETPRLAHRPARKTYRMMESKPVPENAFVGVDVFFESTEQPEVVAAALQERQDAFKLTMMSNRGTQVWPTGSVFTDCINHYRARLELVDETGDEAAAQQAIVALLGRIAERYRLCGAEWLRKIAGKRGYALAQGQG